MSPRVVITGATGLLGRALVEEALARGLDVSAIARTPAPPVAGVPVHAIDLTAPGAAARVIEGGPVDAVVHAAALTDVDACEARPDEARRLHVDATAELARAAAARSARFLHVSTDAVFDGRRDAYEEGDEPRPLNVYARTKRDGERAALAAHPGALVVRTNLFGARPGGTGRSLAEWALREFAAGREVSGFEDVRFNPLWTGHLAGLLVDLALGKATGVLHVAARDAATKADFLRRLARAFGVDPARVKPARASDRVWRAPRPLCTVLAVDRAATLLGRPLPDLDAEIDAFRAWARDPKVGLRSVEERAG